METQDRPVQAPDHASVHRATLNDASGVAAIERLDPMALLPGRTIHQALVHAAATWPDKPAVVQLRSVDDEDPPVVTFSAYLRRAEQAANLFHASSGGALPVVAVVAPYLSEALIAMWGGGIAGRYVPVNPYLELDHICGIMNAARATVLVIATARVGPGVWERLDALVAKVPTLKRTFLIDAPGHADDFTTALTDQPDGLTFQPASSSDADCAYLHTGGTTATPKLVRHTHGGQLLGAWFCGTAMGSAEDEVIGHAMPNFHVGGAIAMGMRGILFGQTLITLTANGFRDPALVPAFWDVVRRHGMTSITTAPTTAAAIMAVDGGGPATLRHYTTGGGPLSPDLARTFERRFGLPLREVWGGTEFHGILSFHYGGQVAPRLGSCGRDIPFHRVISAILDGNRFVRPAAEGERGILIASGPALSPGYVDPSIDAAFFIEDGPDGVRWATTGDIGHVDPDRFIWINGREKDVIIRGGHNIDSATIDDVLVRHPAVLHAAAVGKPCPMKGELPMAYVQLRPGASATAEDIRAFAREHIQERAAAPVEIVILDAIPMTAVGKVSKPPLRIDALRREADRVARSAASTTPVTVAIDDTGGRPTVVARLDQPDAEAAERLRAAFAPFTFASRIEQPDLASA